MKIGVCKNLGREGIELMQLFKLICVHFHYLQGNLKMTQFVCCIAVKPSIWD